MRRSRGKENVLDQAADLFDLPEEVVAGMSRITVTGCRRVFIESHRGILEYGDSAISVNGGKAIIRIRGTKLKIQSMNSSDLLITGMISGIDFDV